MSEPLDDFLGLLDRPLADERALFFTGVSGSGKSTCIELLLRSHPSWAGKPSSRVGPGPIDWSAVRPEEELVVVDEIHRPVELAPLCRLLRRGHRLLVASHVSERWLGGIGLAWPIALFRTDVGTAKLARFLGARGLGHTPERLDDFVARYGSSYTDLEIVLERTPGADFDRAFHRFERTSSITRCRRERPA